MRSAALTSDGTPPSDAALPSAASWRRLAHAVRASRLLSRPVPTSAAGMMLWARRTWRGSYGVRSSATGGCLRWRSRTVRHRLRCIQPRRAPPPSSPRRREGLPEEGGQQEAEAPARRSSTTAPLVVALLVVCLETTRSGFVRDLSTRFTIVLSVYLSILALA